MNKNQMDYPEFRMSPTEYNLYCIDCLVEKIRLYQNDKTKVGDVQWMKNEIDKHQERLRIIWC